MTMENFEKKHARPLVFGLSTAAAVILGLSAFAAGDVSAQTPSGTSTSAATTPTATTTTTSGTTATSSPSASASKSATGVAGAPQTGSGVASNDSSTMPIVLGGLAAVGGGLALFGASMKKRNS